MYHAIALVIILITCVFSYNGLKSPSFFERFLFRVDDILIRKDYKRLVTSGLLHVSWQHLIFNMLSLYFFSPMLELYIGSWAFVMVYLAGLIGGDLLALFVHRHHGDYSSAGASGAIAGVIFGCLALFPGMDINLFLTLPIPGWIYGLGYVLYSIYGIRSRTDNVGHEAHLGGAMVGMFTAIAFKPDALLHNYITIAIIAVPALVFMFVIIRQPHVLLVDNLFFKQHHTNATLDDRYNMARHEQVRDIDDILDKIHRKGLGSLSKAERERLDEYSRTK